MPDLYEELVSFRPTSASELLPQDTSDHVVLAIRAARRRRSVAAATVGTVISLVVGLVLWNLVPRTTSSMVAGTPSIAGPSTASPGAVVVTTPQMVRGTVSPRPIADLRVGTGLIMMQWDGEPIMLCLGAATADVPGHCSTLQVSGVSWDQITWKDKGPLRSAMVDVIGVLSGSTRGATFAVEQIAPAGTFTVSSDNPTPLLPPSATPAPSYADLITAIQDATAMGSLLRATPYLDQRSVDLTVIANTPEVAAQAVALVRAHAPTASVVLTPALLTIT
jgi:hypothetical protein